MSTISPSLNLHSGPSKSRRCQVYVRKENCDIEKAGNKALEADSDRYTGACCAATTQHGCAAFEEKGFHAKGEFDFWYILILFYSE